MASIIFEAHSATPDKENHVLPDSDSAYLFRDIKPNQIIWLAKDDDEIVGGVKVSLESGATGKDIIGDNVGIDTLVVESSERGKGYGRAILEAAEDWVKTQADLPKTISLAVETDNEVAIKLYESLGYEALFSQGGAPTLIDSDTPGKQCYIMFKHLTEASSGA